MSGHKPAGGNLYDIRPRQRLPIPWGWENDESGKWVVKPRGEILMPRLVDFFNWEDSWELDPIREITVKGKPAGSGVIGSTSMKSVFTTATRFLGMEEALVRLVEGRLHLWQIAEEMLSWNRKLLRSLPFRRNLEIMVLGDEVGTSRGMLMSPELYRREILPIHTTFQNVAFVHGVPMWFHADGDVSKILPDIVAAGFAGMYFQDIGGMRAALDKFPELPAIEMERDL